MLKLGALFGTGLGLGGLGGIGAAKLAGALNEKELLSGKFLGKKAQWDLLRSMEEKLGVIEEKVEKVYLSTLEKIEKVEDLLTKISEKKP